MKNIAPIYLFKTETKRTALGTLIHLETPFGISEHGSIASGDKTLLANYVYDRDGNYKTVYTVLDTEGNETSFEEDDGILPTLFLSPAGENYVSIVPYHPDKELEISMPVFKREAVDLPKGNRPFTGNFVGTSAPYALFFDVDPWSDTKPDKMLTVEFKGGKIKKKHQIKVPLPRRNKIFVENNGIHLLARDQDQWVHRLIDGKGTVIKQRTLSSNRPFFREILSLSFDADSYLLAEEQQGELVVERVDIVGNSEPIERFKLGDPLYNTWQPVKIADHTFIIRFNGEFGNGWLTMRKGALVELFYSKKVAGYRNLLTDEVLEMDDDDLIISSVNKTAENAYAVVFYPRTDRDSLSKKIIVLNRKVRG